MMQYVLLSRRRNIGTSARPFRMADRNLVKAAMMRPCNEAERMRDGLLRDTSSRRSAGRQ